MQRTMSQAFQANLLGNAPRWYKLSILAFLVLNPLLLHTAGPFIAGWALILEFIFTLAMALKCYPLPAGGLLTLEAVALGMASPQAVYNETLHNFPVILLLMFMVAGIYFMQDMLRYVFTKILVRVRSKVLISLMFCVAGAVLSAFLDALTVVAVIITVAYGFYDLYHRHVSGMTEKRCLLEEAAFNQSCRDELMQFRGFLRNIMMHGAVGTALGGVCTLVGEPQNLLVGSEMGWNFVQFFLHVAPVSLPVLAVGLTTCVAVERFRLFGYGVEMPLSVRVVLVEEARKREESLDGRGRLALLVQAVAGIWLVVALGFHLAEVGLIGLSVIILLTALNGVVDEHRIGNAFKEALPFTALLVVFFGVVAVIHEQHLFKPVIDLVLALKGREQLAAYYLANGLLSAISDNVFVATVYISETKKIFDAGLSGMTREQFELLAVAINTGTNIPSVATPNGQAAFLFLLTSSLAPVIRLSYGRMVMLALPYTITMTLAGLVATWFMI